MARLWLAREPTVSLFPMFNILVSTLGVLVFILGTIATLALGPGKTVAIVPEALPGSETEKQPTYLEWDGESLVLYPEGQRASIAGDLGELGTFDAAYAHIDEAIRGTGVGDALDRLAREHNTEYAILLLRPSGFDSFFVVRGYFENKQIGVGYEPIDQDWNIRIGE